MMKKVLILFAGLSLLASCAQNLEPTDKGKEKDPGTEKPVSADQELTLNTRANLTKAIAEETNVPTDNFIGLMPNFQSDIAGVRYDEYNQIRPFGFDDNKGVWRGVAAKKDGGQSIKDAVKSLLSGLQQITYVSNPFYWPGGDRVTMDYVAYSYFNMRDVLYNTVANRYNLARQLSQYGEYIDYVVAANPYKFNANRMNVWYQNQILNVLSYAMMAETESSIVLSPYVLSVVLALGALTDEGILMPGADYPVTITAQDILDILDPVVDKLVSGEDLEKEEMKQYLENLMNKLRTPIEFIQDFDIAYDVLNGDESKIGEEEGQITEERLSEVVNKAYWLFFNTLPKVGKYIQDDLLYSFGRGLKNTKNGQIDATFNHAKAWVKVVVNNMTDNDLFVTGVSFDNVKTGGTLVIDNSKSAFEVYWDFVKEPYHPDYEPVETGIGFEAYNPMTLQPSNGAIPSVEPGIDEPILEAVANAGVEQAATAQAEVKEEKKPQQSHEPKSEKNSGWQGLLEGVGELISGEELIGYIPDTYLVPAHCYGPALRVDTISQAQQAKSQAGQVGHNGLIFTCLNGERQFNSDVARNLSGAMFPSQEPGTISLSYYTWETRPIHPSIDEYGRTSTSYPMERLLKNLNQNLISGNLNNVTLNLPRVKWEMGKVYIYVINIGNNEITINSQLVPWESQIVTGEEEEDVPGSTDPVEVTNPDWQWNN